MAMAKLELTKWLTDNWYFASNLCCGKAVWKLGLKNPQCPNYSVWRNGMVADPISFQASKEQGPPNLQNCARIRRCGRPENVRVETRPLGGANKTWSSHFYQWVGFPAWIMVDTIGFYTQIWGCHRVSYNFPPKERDSTVVDSISYI